MSFIVRMCCSCFVPVLSFALIGCGASGEPEAEPKPYRPPPISVATMDDIRTMLEEARGSVVVMNLWATWCPPCVVETPELSRFFRDFGEDRIVFLSVSADEPGEREQLVRRFVNSYEIPFPVYVVGPQKQDAINLTLGIDWDGLYPGTFLFGPDGALLRTWAGDVQYEELAAESASLLGD